MNIFKKIINIFKPSPDDPVYFCDVHKEIGCSHVDGFLCHMATCEILAEYKEQKKQKEKENE